MGAVEVSKEVQDFQVILQKAVNAIKTIQHKCLIHNFNLVEIQLPVEMYQVLKQSSLYKSEIKKDTDDLRGFFGTFEGIRVVEVPYISRPRYVVEGDLQIL